MQNFINNIKKQYDLFRASSVDTSDIKTVNLIVGPYRNLTTLLGGLLFLHPNIQVLNHAGERIFDDEHVDFIQHIEPSIFANFTKYAIHIAQSGERGSRGGSITKSHAFDDKNPLSNLDMPHEFNSPIQALVWKDSLRVVAHIRKHYQNVDPLLEKYPQLQFILPVRDPMDCSTSNNNTNHMRNVLGIDGKSLSFEAMLDLILDEHLWVIKQATRYPNRFHVIFQHEFTRENFSALGEFLKINPSDSWLDAVEKGAVLTQKYTYSAEQWQYYNEAVQKRFKAFPDYLERFLQFSQG